MRIAYPCQTCHQLTEFVELSTCRFFCSTVCAEQEPVIRSTREIRKTPRLRCPVASDQKCHIFGLNAAKVIINHYALQCERIDEETLKRLVVAINARNNIECCTPQKNLQDKETEKAFLDVFIYKTRPYKSLDIEAQRMYLALKMVFGELQQSLSQHSEVIQTILEDFESLSES